MVLSEVVNTQYAIPVGIVLICAILVFVFGFKSAEQPAFDQLTTYSGDDRKPAGKKRKLKDKKSQSNGHATAVGDKQAELKSYSTKAAKSEKSPLKEVSNKVVNKQVKKPESSPIKEKALAKQRDNKKEVDKQLKEKKQATEKSPIKDNKNVTANIRGKGKENQLEEIKNKKNEKNLAKVKNLERKSGDDGGWKQVLSNKDKKNRKKDELEYDDVVPDKNVKLEGTPKNKKAKSIELTVIDVPSNKENKDIEEGKEIEIEAKKSEKVKKSNKTPEKILEVEKIVEEVEKKEKSEKKEKPEKKKTEKQSEKKKKVEQESKGEKEVDDKVKVEEKTKVIEEIFVADNKSAVELSPDAAVVAKKKNKKKTDEKKEAAIETVEDAVALKNISESSENEDSNKQAKPVETDVSESNADPAVTVVIDESDDAWKEAKVPKKNKKKVRKDQ